MKSLFAFCTAQHRSSESTAYGSTCVTYYVWGFVFEEFYLKTDVLHTSLSNITFKSNDSKTIYCLYAHFMSKITDINIMNTSCCLLNCLMEDSQAGSLNFATYSSGNMGRKTTKSPAACLHLRYSCE